MNLVTAKSLIKRCRIKARISDSDGVFSDEEILHTLNDQLHNRVVPFYMAFKSNYFLSHKDFLFKNPLDLPTNAINQKIERIEALDEDGNVLGNLHQSQPNQTGFFFENDKIVFHNTEPHSVRLWFYRRPSALTLDYTSIALINSRSRQLTLSETKSEWEAGPYEFSRVRPLNTGVVEGMGHLYDIEARVVSGGNFLVLDYWPEIGVEWQDLVSPAGTSPIAQIPYEASYFLVLLTCIAFNLDDSLTLSLQHELQALEHHLQRIATPRVEGNSKPFTRKTLFSSDIWD